MFPVDPLLQKVNKILGKDYTHRTHLETILDLTLLVEKQQKELTDAECRELSYIDDIQQLDAMVDQANGRITKFQEDIEIKNKHIEILGKSNRDYIKALEDISKPGYFDADDQH